MRTFKLNAIIRKVGFVKQDGCGVAQILVLMLMLPLLLLNSLCLSEFPRITMMKKDVIYGLKNHDWMPWHRILYGVAKRFQTLSNPQKIVADMSASGSVDLKQFQPSSEYAALKALCAESFLGNQLEAFNKFCINRSHGMEKKWRFSRVG